MRFEVAMIEVFRTIIAVEAQTLEEARARALMLNPVDTDDRMMMRYRVAYTPDMERPEN